MVAKTKFWFKGKQCVADEIKTVNCILHGDLKMVLNDTRPQQMKRSIVWVCKFRFEINVNNESSKETKKKEENARE